MKTITRSRTVFFTATSPFENCWTGTSGPGTLGALPLSYWPAGSKANRLRVSMDQVGFEPRSSRVAGEVTLSFTTSNSVAFRQIRAGRKIEQSSGTTVPRRFTDEVTLLRTIPADPMGTIGSRLLFELLASCEAGGFSMPHLSGCPELFWPK